mmetsp:Transcript_5792/g.16331  ORF Transcript_5792/g.16331 Transcript_5792/m.16331 type:complete len:82 (+) Transcript_5792:53-298(+)
MSCPSCAVSDFLFFSPNHLLQDFFLRSASFYYALIESSVASPAPCNLSSFAVALKFICLWLHRFFRHAEEVGQDGKKKSCM